MSGPEDNPQLNQDQQDQDQPPRDQDQSNQDQDQSSSSNEITLYVNNLPLSCTQDDVKKLFEQFGSVVNVCNRQNKKTGQFSGNSFVTLAQKEDGERAIDKLHESIFQGNKIIVERSNRPFLRDYKGKPDNNGPRRSRDDRNDRQTHDYRGGHYRDDRRYQEYRPSQRTSYDRSSYDMGPPSSYSRRGGQYYDEPYYGGGGYDDSYRSRYSYRDYPECDRRQGRYDRRDDYDNQYDDDRRSRGNYQRHQRNDSQSE